jgi:predicted oxidoreductase
MDADVIVIGCGLAACCDGGLIDAGRKVILLDQEGEQSLGGQAFWSFGGLMLVGSPEQRRLGIRDSHDLALQDWMGSAGFDRAEDHWPKRWAEAYVAFAAGEKRAWLRGKGVRWFPIVGWAERGGYTATEHGNSVPRFHVTWGTGPGLIAPFVRRVREGAAKGRVSLRFRHRVSELTTSAGVVDGVRGEVLEPTSAERGAPSSRTVSASSCFKAQAVIVTSGGIGANIDLVRQSWPKRLGEPPKRMICGVPDHVDGRMLAITEAAGRQPHQPRPHVALHRGHHQLEPDLEPARHPHSAWSVGHLARRARAASAGARCFRAFDTLGTLEHIMRTG